MEAIPVIDSSHLVPLPNGRAILVGAPPEALKVLVLWEYPFPSTVILPPDPLFAEGLNQASFEFLLYNHLFRMNGLRNRSPFTVVCDPNQRERVEELVRHMIQGPTEEELQAWGTPADERYLLLRETAAVSGEIVQLPLEQVVRVVAFEQGRVELPDGALIEAVAADRVRISYGQKSVETPRKALQRASLPLYFPDVEKPMAGPRFGLQIIGSASGFSGSEWGSCFLVWINGQPLVVDGTPYLTDHLRRLGIEDDHILGYLITHNHEDHANALGQLLGRRPVTLLTSPAVMAGLASRLSALLDIPTEEVRRLFRWVPLTPGMESCGETLHWFGAEIRTWYSVHTIPTLGVEFTMDGRRIRMPGDTLWGSQLDPLVEAEVVSPRRARFIRETYQQSPERRNDILVVDAGGGPIHPDPREVRELLDAAKDDGLLVTHIPEYARDFLPPAEPGTNLTLVPREERAPEDAMALYGSPVLRGTPERWLLALLYGGEMAPLAEKPTPVGDDAFLVLAGTATVGDASDTRFSLQRGDLYHPDLTPELVEPHVAASTRWTRLLRVPTAMYQAFMAETRHRPLLEHLFRTRRWWGGVVGEELGLEMLVRLSELTREREYQPGEAVVRQGDRAEHFYVVTGGRVEVVRGTSPDESDEQVIGAFGAGFHFGEIALLGNEMRTATVRAAEPATVLEVQGQAFLHYLMDIPMARYRVSRLAATRRAQLTKP